jgi:hypothetical protein
MRFAEHQTFYIREGWLFKGMAAVVEAESKGQLPTIFLDDDAPERMGIGRNMVRALRFWMQATGITNEKKEQNRFVQHLTSFGNLVWRYDRYLENEPTLWLIHYHLACSEDKATTWYWFFNHFAPVVFDDRSFLEALARWVMTVEPDKKIAQSSIKKDVFCLLKTYLPDNELHTPENLIESPLAQLNILSQVEYGPHKRYRLEQIDPVHLDPLVLLYVIVDRQMRVRPEVHQVRLSQVLREPMNAGRVFNLTTALLGDLLAELNKHHPDWRVQFVRTSGLDHLTLPQVEPLEILDRFYTEQIGLPEVA